MPDSYEVRVQRRSSGAVTAMFDPVTGFFTLPVLEEFLRYEIDGYAQTLANERFVTPLCVVAIGIDTLYAVDDGDERQRMLRMVAGTVQRATRAADRLARHGDELVALLRRTLSANVRDYYAPRLRGMLAEVSPDIPSTPTVSLGIASLTEHVVRNPQDMIAKALRALEAAREIGPASLAVYDLREMPIEPAP